MHRDRSAGSQVVSARTRSLSSVDATVLHVFVERSNHVFFTRTHLNRNVPQVCIDPATLPEAFNATVPLARPGRCQAQLKNLPEDRVCSVLDAAAQFRLRQKANRIRKRSKRTAATKRFSRRSR